MFVSDNLMYTNNNITSQTPTNTSAAVETNNEINDSEAVNYAQKVDSSVQINLGFDGLKPSDGCIYIWDKTYKENDFLCTKHKSWTGKSVIIKEQTPSLSKIAYNIMIGYKSEKIIEEYNKNNELTKRTYYQKDGSYVVSKYNSDGSVEKEVVVKNTDNKDLGYKSEIKKTYYNEDGSYRVVNQTYEMNQNSNDVICTESNVTYYDKNGKVDVLSTTINAAIINTVEGIINPNT